MLAGCPTQQEWAQSLTGSWQGEKDGDGWCLTLQGPGTSEKGEGAAMYRSIIRKKADPEFFHAEGIWYVGEGGRLQVNLYPVPLDENFNPLTPTEYKTESFRYLIKSLEQDKLVYHEHTPKGEFGDLFASKRVGSCDQFFKS